MLVVCYNNIDKETCLVLADVIRNNDFIRDLDLRDNKIGDAIFDALKNNNSLERLYLDKNLISVEGAIAIAAALRINKSLKKLNLVNNNIGDEGVISIRDALSTNGSLKHLDLENNIRISEQTRNDIASTIRADITFVH
jgi:Ran GTPase-activating protein (RanGAP) involved in mRNA processing and transport